jgi:hypothetical protein
VVDVEKNRISKVKIEKGTAVPATAPAPALAPALVHHRDKSEPA